MNSIRRLRRRIRFLFASARAEEELSEELRHHIDMEAEELVRDGWTPDTARREALRRFGGEESTKEHVRDARGGRLLLDLIQDVRYAGRQLRKSPGFAAVAVLTLALGIGANALVFGLMEATLLRAPAVRSPETLAAVYTTCRRGEPRCSSSYLDYVDYRDRTRAFEDLAAYSPSQVNLGSEMGAEFVSAELVSGNYFDLLGVGATRGRLLLPADDMAGGDIRVAVLSHATWQNRFGGDAGVIGETVRINDLPYTVVGVAEASFEGLRLGESPALWIPLRAQADLSALPGGLDFFERRGVRWIGGLVARLGEGVSVERAREELRTVSDQLAIEDPDARGPRTVTVDPLPSYIHPNGSEQTISTFVWVLQGVVGFTLLLACANLANLLLARGSSRRRELALRTAIGGARGRLVRQLLTESLVLAVLGAGVGLVLAALTLSAMGGFELPFGFDIASLDAEVNSRVAAFTALLAIGTVVAFGVLPAFQGTRGDLTLDLRDVRATGGTRSRRLLRGLVVVQVAICFLLLVGAGLFMRTLRHQLDTDLGFQPEGVAVMVLAPEASGYSDSGSAALTRDLVESLNQIPGVEAASAGARVPVIPSGMGTFVEVEGYTPAADEEMRVEYNYVAPDYFRTLELPILRGRGFSDTDAPGAPGVLVINEAMAEAWWPGRDPIGGIVRFAQIGPDGTEQEEYTVVGIVGEVPWEGLATSPSPYAYRPLLQDEPGGTMRVIVRADPTRLEALLPIMRDRLREIDPNVAVVALLTMPRAIATILAPERAGAALLGAFAGLALLLACIGIYGVVAYVVEQRQRELGIRIALGAPISSVVALVAGGMSLPVVLGIAVGLAGVLALGPLMRGLLAGVEPGDPLTMILTMGILGISALAAIAVPARRAARADPMEAMRGD